MAALRRSPRRLGLWSQPVPPLSSRRRTQKDERQPGPRSGRGCAPEDPGVLLSRTRGDFAKASALSDLLGPRKQAARLALLARIPSSAGPWRARFPFRLSRCRLLLHVARRHWRVGKRGGNSRRRGFAPGAPGKPAPQSDRRWKSSILGDQNPPAGSGGWDPGGFPSRSAPTDAYSEVSAFHPRGLTCEEIGLLRPAHGWEGPLSTNLGGSLLEAINLDWDGPTCRRSLVEAARRFPRPPVSARVCVFQPLPSSCNA